MPAPMLPPLDMAAVQVPHHFRCPISLELMRDPVTVTTGITYDRCSIEPWLAGGNLTCPVTRSPLQDSTLIPNHTLRRLIQQWCVDSRCVERIPTPRQPADVDQVKAILAEAAGAGLRKLRLLALESEKNRAVMATTETRAALLKLAFARGDDDTWAEAVAVLAVIGLTETEALDIAGDENKLSRLAKAVCDRAASLESRINAAAVVESIAAALDLQRRAAVGAVGGLMDGLTSLVQETVSVRAARVASRALLALCVAKENRPRAVAAGAASALAKRIVDCQETLAVLDLLCRTEKGRDAAIAGAGGGAAIVRKLVRAMWGKAGEHAVSALTSVVSSSESLQREAVSAGAMKRLLLMVQGGCNERAKSKAQMLLKVLRAAWPAVAANSDELLQPF